MRRWKKKFKKKHFQVKEYSDTFWKRYDELTEGKKYVANIVKGEERIEKKKLTEVTLDRKVARYKSPFYQLRFEYTTTGKTKNYTEEEDR